MKTKRTRPVPAAIIIPQRMVPPAVLPTVPGEVPIPMNPAGLTVPVTLRFPLRPAGNLTAPMS